MIPEDLKYTKDHEGVRVEAAGAVVGITDHAQKALGDIVFVELPAVGRKLAQHQEMAVVESVKAAFDIYAPVSGEVIAVNKELESHPEIINADPYGNAWIVKIGKFPENDATDLMDAAAYDAFVTSES